MPLEVSEKDNTAIDPVKDATDDPEKLAPLSATDSQGEEASGPCQSRPLTFTDHRHPGAFET